MHIYFSTGIGMVKGAQYKEWAVNEFDKVKCYIKDIPIQDGSHQPIMTNHISNKELEIQVENLHHEDETIKTSLRTYPKRITN